MHEVNFVDDTFDLKKTSEYDLSIQVGLDGFSFCIADIYRKKILALKHIPLIVGKLQFLTRKVETIFDQEEELSKLYKSVSISYSTNLATIIPKIYAGNSIHNSIAEFTFELNKSLDFQKTDLNRFNYQLIFCYPKELMTLFNRKYTEFRFNHKSNLLISYLNNQQINNSALLLNFETKYIRVIALKGNDIAVYNSFYYKNETDVLYYTLYICNILQLDPEQIEIMIGGYVADDSGFIRQLKKYIHNVHFLTPNSEYDYGSLFKKIQKHQFVSLLNSLS